MKKICIVKLSLLVFLIFSFHDPVSAWDNQVTHRDLSKYAAASSTLRLCNNAQDQKCDYLKNLGLDKGLLEILEWNGSSTIKKGKVEDWLREGAFLEDAGSRIDALTGKARFNNHFHNPLKPWDEAGLSDIQTGESSLKWAQDGSAQMNRVEGDWSWQTVRNYFYNALIATDNSSRQTNFAKTFRGLGHQIHLLQDAAVPDHVRNDAHPEDELFGKNPLNGIAYFETWAKNEKQRIIDLTANPVFPNVPFNVSYNGFAPTTQLYDTDQYNGFNASAGINQGLAEYTNANFFSSDTIFAAELYSQDDKHYFPYPKKSSTDLQAYIAQLKPLFIQIAEDGLQDK